MPDESEQPRSQRHGIIVRCKEVFHGNINHAGPFDGRPFIGFVLHDEQGTEIKQTFFMMLEDAEKLGIILADSARTVKRLEREEMEQINANYEFMAEDGQVIEQVHSMKSCPDEVDVDGKKYKRVAISPGNKIFFNDAQVASQVDGYPRPDYTMPRGTDVGKGCTPEGHPIISSRLHEKEVEAKYGFRRD